MSFRTVDLLYAMSRYAQADYQTPVVPVGSGTVSHHQLLATKGSTSFEIGVTLQDNAEQATGSDRPTETYLGKQVANATVGMQVDVEHLVRQLYAHFGAISSAITVAAGGGEPAVYTHTIDEMNLANSLQLPAYEFVKRQPGSLASRALPSMVSRELSFEFIPDAQEQRATFTQQWAGSGRAFEPANLIWSPDSGYHVLRATGRKYFTGLHGAFRKGDYDGSGAGQNVVDYADCTVRKVSGTFTNGFNDAEGLCPGAGKYFYQISGAGVAILWKATTAHALNSYLVVGGRVYKVTSIGSSPNQSGASAPTHTTGTAANGDLTLQFVGYNGIAAFGASTPVLLGEYIAYADRLYRVTIAGTTDASVVPTHTTSTAANGTATLLFIIVMSESGAVKGQELIQTRTSTLEAIVDAKSDSPFVSELRNQTPLDLVWGWVGGVIRPSHNYQALFHYYKITWETVEEIDLNGFLRYRLRPRVQLDQAQNKVVQVVCKNTSAATEYVA